MRGTTNNMMNIRNGNRMQQHAPMTGAIANKKMMGQTTSRTKKIVIKPFVQPPKLPDNFYEQTSKEILQGTLQYLQQNVVTTSTATGSTMAMDTKSTSSSSPTNYSLQSAYTNTVHLVSHQFGGRLYADLVQTLQTAAEIVLRPLGATTLHTDGRDNNNSGGNTSNSTTMLYVVEQYRIYTEYLILCKRVLNPLDRAWQWQDDAQRAIPITASGTTAAVATTVIPPTAATTVGSDGGTKPPKASSHQPLQTIWEVGLTIFLRRLRSLKYDDTLYQQWLAAFLNDWNPQPTTDNLTSSSSSISRQTLQQVWYLWKDLGMLKELTIQSDLQKYWSAVSNEWMNNLGTTSDSSSRSSSNSTTIAQFIRFCYDKHTHCYQYRQWLPITWLWSLLDTFLFQPHLISPGSNITPNNATMYSSSSTTTTPPVLLQAEHLHPILHEELLHQKQRLQHNSSSPTTENSWSASAGTTGSLWSTVQILWMLSGRISGGQKVLTTAIQRFARIQGLQCAHGNKVTLPASVLAQASGPKISPSNLKPPPLSTNANSNVNVIEELLQLQDSLSAMIQSLPITQSSNILLGPSSSSVLGTSASSIISLKSVWEEVVNVDIQPSIAEQLAKFLDGILKSTKKMDDYQNQQFNLVVASSLSSSPTSAGQTTAATTAAATSSTAWLQRIVMGLFVPLASKDIFEAFYKKDLAKRLIWNRVVSMDVEKHVCSLLKAECGSGFTSKMEGMFQDIEMSRDTMSVFKEAILNNYPNVDISANSVEMEVQVLTTGYWPVYPQYPNLHLPETLVQPETQFTNYYKTKYQGRRMTWQYALGHCVVRAMGFNKPYELLVSLCQAVTLTQFTSDDTSPATGGWTLPKLLTATGVDDRDEMERILQSLSVGKEGTRILRKIDYDRDVRGSSSPSDKSGTTSPQKKQAPSKKIRTTVDDRDIFIINVGFDSKVRRIRINNILMKETKEEHDKTVEGISRDRLYLIDAVLVRIMKARKTILHQQLIPQVLEQIKVPASAADIKLRIESLIEREYMERDSNDRNRYNYLA